MESYKKEEKICFLTTVTVRASLGLMRERGTGKGERGRALCPHRGRDARNVIFSAGKGSGFRNIRERERRKTVGLGGRVQLLSKRERRVHKEGDTASNWDSRTPFPENGKNFQPGSREAICRGERTHRVGGLGLVGREGEGEDSLLAKKKKSAY